MLQDRYPDIVSVLALALKQLLQLLVLHGEGARQRLVRVDVCRDRLDPCRCTPH